MSTPDRPDPVVATPRLRPGRRPWGSAAVLLPHHPDGTVDWDSFTVLLTRTVAAGLTPAVNMDTGFVQLLDDDTRRRVLAVTASLVDGSPFLAGAFVADRPGDAFAPGRHTAALTEVAAAGGIPVLFPCHGLNALSPGGWVDAHHLLGAEVDRFIGFELGAQFVPYGRIQPIEAYRDLLGVRACIGAKHSSLSRVAEWERLATRDELRPDFHVFTGNDLAIDMVTYGSDYLLGLAAFAPDHFARRDERWAAGDPAWAELNDLLQFLGAFSFRAPVPAYRHDAALFLHHRGWIDSPTVPAGAPTRTHVAAEVEVLAGIAADLDADAVGAAAALVTESGA